MKMFEKNDEDPKKSRKAKQAKRINPKDNVSTKVPTFKSGKSATPKAKPVGTLTRSVKTVMKPASGDSLKPSIKLPDPMTSFKSGMSEARKQALMNSPKGPNAQRPSSAKKSSRLKEAVKSISPSSLKSKASSIKEEYKSRTISKKPYGK